MFLSSVSFDIDDTAPEARHDALDGDIVDRRSLTLGNEADKDLLADESCVFLTERQTADRYPATGAHRRSPKQDRRRAGTGLDPARNDRAVGFADSEYRHHEALAQSGISDVAKIDPLGKNRHAGAIEMLDPTGDLAGDVDRFGVAL